MGGFFRQVGVGLRDQALRDAQCARRVAALTVALDQQEHGELVLDLIATTACNHYERATPDGIPSFSPQIRPRNSAAMASSARPLGTMTAHTSPARNTVCRIATN